jgi:hypothetical protein
MLELRIAAARAAGVLALRRLLDVRLLLRRVLLLMFLMLVLLVR